MNQIKQIPLLFTLGSNPSLSKKVSALLDLPLSPTRIFHFDDGEVFAKPLCSVNGRDCLILHSTFRPVSERLMDLFVFIDALKNAKANHITVIMPYYGYSRQDRIVEEGDPITGLLVAKMLKAAGVDEFVTVDFHSLSLLSRFPFPHTNLSAIQLFAKRFGEELSQRQIPFSEVTVVSPDKGGLRRAQIFSSYFAGSAFAYADKTRPSPNKAVVEAINGGVAGRLCIVVDDMIDTAGTLSEVVKALLSSGAKEVWVAATHGIFSGKAVDIIPRSGVKMLLISDTIELPSSLGETISVAPIIAEFLKAKISE
jgi:ribose-phosphate pyrophosphokinase